ncbi:MAG TPA: efflux transporter outer membrane subunit [Stellaceae bacterium]|nr:efflux transporter outer membrane subunit [Stellaceae bacterium]
MKSTLAGALGAVLALAACTVGPDYRRPSAPVPVHYKEAGWKIGQPADALDRGPWWRIYRDPVLDRLERRIDISNQNLKAAAAAFREAEAIVAEGRAGFFPTLTASASAQRSRSGGGSRGGAGVAGAAFGGGAIANFFSQTASASWVPDLWGRVRRTVESEVASAEASAADLANARLSAESTLASDYFQLRIADALKRLLDQTIAAYTESLRITRNQFAAGVAAPSDVAQAEAQLAAAQAQQIALGVNRADLEHAIAVLTGRPPAELAIAPTPSVSIVPEIPPGVPSALLERRPDIAAAERRMAAANAQIGVAEAAFFPDLTLSGDAGTEASKIGRLFDASNVVWAFGGQVAETLFEGGLRHAQVAATRAVLLQNVALYRQTVLTAFQQVEDELAALRILAVQQQAAERAATAAREAERVIFNQYKAGLIPYTNVVVAQATALADAETALSIRQSRLVASVSLIEALGGGWRAAQLPDRRQIEKDVPLDFSPLPPADAVHFAPLR